MYTTPIMAFCRGASLRTRTGTPVYLFTLCLNCSLLKVHKIKNCAQYPVHRVYARPGPGLLVPGCARGARAACSGVVAPRRARPCVELDPPAVRALATRRDAEAQGLSNVGLEPSYIHTASRETHVHATRHKHKPSCEHLFSIRIPARAAAQGSSRSARSVAWLATYSLL